MGLRRPLLVVVALLIPAGARAGDHKADEFFALSYLEGPGSTIKLGGLEVSLARTPSREHRSFACVGDLSVHFLGGEEGSDQTDGEGTDQAQQDVTQVTFMVGARWTPLGDRQSGKHKGEHKHHMPFMHFMVGFVDRTGGSHPSETAFALTGGVGWDWVPGDKRTWGSRVQIDYIRPVSSDMRHSWRFSAGAVYRIHFDHPPGQ